MNVVVCIKQVPSTETRIRVNTQTGFVDLSEVEWVVNPYDEYAIETGLRIREKLGAGSVSAVTLGPERTRTALKNALSMGCDRAVHVMDTGVEDIDPLSRGRVLAAAVKREPFDLVLCGKQAVDDDLGFVPQATAHFLGIPHVATVQEVVVEPGRPIICRREIEGATEIVELSPPCLVTIQKGSFEPRYPTLKLMMAAKKKEIPVITAQELGLDPGALTRGLEYVEDRLPPGRAAGKRIEGEPVQVVSDLVRLLREEAKVM